MSIRYSSTRKASALLLLFIRRCRLASTVDSIHSYTRASVSHVRVAKERGNRPTQAWCISSKILPVHGWTITEDGDKINAPHIHSKKHIMVSSISHIQRPMPLQWDPPIARELVGIPSYTCQGMARLSLIRFAIPFQKHLLYWSLIPVSKSLRLSVSHK